MLRTALVAGLTGLCTVAAGATYYSANSARSEIDKLITASRTSLGALRLEERSREESLTATRGRLAVAVDTGCAAAGEPGEIMQLPLVLDYRFDHLPSASGIGRFDIDLSLSEDADARVREVIGARPLFSMKGEVGFSGRVQASFGTPAIEWRDPDSGLQLSVAASSGEVVQRAGDAVDLGWRLPSVRGSGDGGSVEFGPMTITGHYTDPMAGFGQQLIALESVRAVDGAGNETMSMTGLRIEQSQTLQGGHIAAVSSPSITRLDVAGTSFEDLGMRIALERIDAESALRLQALSRADCRTAMQPEHLREIERTLFQLIERGMSVSIDQIRGRRGKDYFEGRMHFALHPQDTNVPTLVHRTEVRLDASVSEGLLPSGLVEPLVVQGFIVQENGHWRTQVALAEGLLKVNDGEGPEMLEAQALDVLDQGQQALVAWREMLDDGQSPLAAVTTQMLRLRSGS